jgi:serine/threonine protein kinase
MIGQAFSHYRIRDQVGSGGMGVVYRAEDVTLRRYVAVKFLPEKVASDRRMVDRFLHEARATAALNHPNICTIYDAGEENGQAYIVMELLEGQTLQQYLAAGPATVPRLLDIATQIAAGLDAAHAKGIIHRDIKPANIHVAHDGRIKILDFGIAKLKAGFDVAGLGAEDGTITFAPAGQPTWDGALVGTVAYMSPEQARGEPLDTRTDLFSFGAVLYEMCAGQGPFLGSTWPVVMNGILSETPPPPSSFARDIPPELDRIVLKALEKDRERRYHDASEISSDLRSLARDVESGRASDPGRSTAPPSAPSTGDLRPPSSGGPSTILPAIEDYLQRFADFGGQPLNVHHYVWPMASVQDASTGEELSTEHVSPLLRRILEEDRNAFALLLGNYGSGKTSFMRMLGNELAAEAVSRRAESLIPIYLSLGFAQGKSDLLQVMSTYLGRYGVSLSATQLKNLLLHHGNVVLLLDGFDEMASGVDYRIVPEILDKIHALQLTSGVRIILSGRSSFFRSEIEVGIVGAGYVVKLQPFDLESMLTYVSRRDPGLTSRAAALFDKHANLRELCRNPIHLMLFVNWLRAADSPLRRLATGGPQDRLQPVPSTAPEDISVVNLYERFFTKTLQDNFGTLTTWALDQRWEFVRRLAWDWFKDGIAEWPMKEFSKRIGAELPELSRDEVQIYTLQLLNCTFFTRIGDRFRFLHQSYLEYLVAEGLCKALFHGDLDMWDTPLYTDIYEMMYRLLIVEGFDRIPIETVLRNGSVRAQANFLAMSFRHRPAAMEVHLRKQLRQNPHEIVRFLAAMGIGLYDGSPQNLECVVAAFASERNTIIKAMIQRVASHWFTATTSPELTDSLRSVVEVEVTLRAEDGGRVMLQNTGSQRDAERALFAFRRAMVQGDQLWTAAVGGILSLGAVQHASSLSYIFSTASQAKHPEIRTAYRLVQRIAPLPELPAD